MAKSTLKHSEVQSFTGKPIDIDGAVYCDHVYVTGFKEGKTVGVAWHAWPHHVIASSPNMHKKGSRARSAYLKTVDPSAREEMEKILENSVGWDAESLLRENDRKLIRKYLKAGKKIPPGLVKSIPVDELIHMMVGHVRGESNEPVHAAIIRGPMTQRLEPDLGSESATQEIKNLLEQHKGVKVMVGGRASVRTQIAKDGRIKTLPSKKRRHKR